MALEKELAIYKNNLATLKANEGKFVLIEAEQGVVNTFTSYEDAMKEGYEKFGLGKPFLVKQIRAIEHVQYVSRLFKPCHTSPSK
jgi:hypothetical protein